MSDQRMIGHYRIVELLGTGAMGKVHVAFDTFIDREVAIKSLRPELTQDPEFVGRFKAEAQSLARLNHPNITTLYSLLPEGSELYMVMELVRGRALDDVLRERGGPLGVKECLAIISQAADGVAYAHQMGVIHRDIKPSNLMIGNDGRVKIMDFGIARVQGSVRMTRAGTAIGTPLYMAPEQRRGSEGDERSDLYALAVVLYEILSGAAPFAGFDEVELLQAQIGRDPPPLVPRIPGVTPELEAALMKALAKRPEQRYPSIRAFSDAIGATVLRVDATSIVQSPAHLLDRATQTSASAGSAASLPSVALAVAKSRSSSLVRRFKSLHPALQGVSVAVLAFAAVAPLLFSGDGGEGLNRRREFEKAERERRTTAELESERRQTAKTLDFGQTGEIKPVRNEIERLAAPTNDAPPAKPKCNEGFSIADCQPSTVPGQKTAAVEQASLGTSSTIADLRRAVKEKEFDRASSIGESLAASGEREAQFIIGMIALKGQGRPQHLPTAFKWIKKAADKDFPEAQAVLGNMYQNGDADGGENVEEALRWYKKAADQNNPRGQFWLGKAFEKGVPNVLKKDAKKAGDLFRLAKTQDFPGAAEALEALRKSGKY
ncbi:protein kinase [Methylosinus sp. R-45379]|uniref:serine/threonine-protein kinase n=1 Tax=Methylosinus sp. R-45379 TaxID=980563 RepID=UPI0007C9343D|nr:serine/threonine-protein kinase [Methylosinus sp. R-45379]OAI26150.1 protein kinase [Methylosinus sp. R-45379]